MHTAWRRPTTIGTPCAAQSQLEGAAAAAGKACTSGGGAAPRYGHAGHQQQQRRDHQGSLQASKADAAPRIHLALPCALAALGLWGQAAAQAGKVPCDGPSARAAAHLADPALPTAGWSRQPAIVCHGSPVERSLECVQGLPRRKAWWGARRGHGWAARDSWAEGAGAAVRVLSTGMSSCVGAAQLEVPGCRGCRNAERTAVGLQLCGPPTQRTTPGVPQRTGAATTQRPLPRTGTSGTSCWPAGRVVHSVHVQNTLHPRVEHLG